MNNNDVVNALSDRRHDAPVLATTPHGSYIFEVVEVDVVDGTDAPLLRLREVGR